MYAGANLVQRTTDGEMGTAGRTMSVYAVVLTAGSDAATVDLRDGGASGTIRLTLKAAAATSVSAEFPGGVVFGSGCYADLTGTGPSVSVAFVG